MPFLREALKEPGLAPSPRTPSQGAGASNNRMPHLGYNRPGFSSPDGGSTAG
ncbi:Transmembrane protein OS=Streptomyces alboniger OX=132473 GN=CP975_17425 PE=4 SV=1 [Streptomyces alboniger]